jgi:hypothetical protein
VEKRARKEEWTGLRAEFEAAQLAKLIPPPPPSLPPVPVAPDGAVSETWLMVRQHIHYQTNSELLDKVRQLIDAKLTTGADLDADELARLTSALAGIVAAEAQLLGLRNRGKERRRSRQPAIQSLPEPADTPQPVELAP